MQVSNADRVVYPDDGITKGDVFDFYTSVSSLLLPFVTGRALTVERFPKGTGGKGFMQKNAPAHYPADLIERHEVPKEGGTTVYPVIDSVEAILFYANLGVITFHVPPVLVSDETQPDWIIWDLDPAPGHTDLVRAAAFEMREVLAAFDIPVVVLASGSKGYHLRTPIQPTVDGEKASFIARATSALAAAANPGLLTLAFRKSERGDRVFVDWLRNSPYSTSVAPWSLRPLPGAPVAAPLSWDEIESIAPDGVGLRDADERFSADPWAHLHAIDVSPVVANARHALDDAGIELEPFDRFRS